MMMRLFINSLAASAGGGLTYIRNVVPHLALRPDLRVTVALSSGLRQEFRECNNIEFLEIEGPLGVRFWHEQNTLPELIRRCQADVLLSTGNFALRRPGVPQILLSRNSVYTSADFYRDLRARHEYRVWLDTRIRGVLARRSILWADCTVAPSQAFAGELRRWTGRPIHAIHHGFDREAFFGDATPLPAAVQEQLDRVGGAVRLLFVSHYNYYRNFETLIRALPLLRQLLPGRTVRLLLTCKLRAGENPGAYNPQSAAKLVKELGISDMVIELGALPYRQLHQLYRRANIYVTPAYTETFAHPLVEAMACGLPIVASDLAVHREICGDAAVYFQRFSAQELAERIAEVVQSSDLAGRLSEAGGRRSTAFSWRQHVDDLISLASGFMLQATLSPPASDPAASPHVAP
jgi:glycosyltransferase involved in cell wall biosynthesis